MPPRALEVRFKHLELIAIYETVILLVLVLHDGTIKQQTLTTEQPYSQDELSQVAQRFNQQLHNAGLAEVERLERTGWEPPLSAFEQTVLELIARAMRQLEGQINERLYHDGLLEMLQQPEFAQPERIRQAIAILEEGKGINPLIPQALSSNGVQVVIGGEHVEDTMREYSVVLARYGRGRDLAGGGGIFGPTRMPYPRSISSVRYISSVMSDLLAELYGQRPDA